MQQSTSNIRVRYCFPCCLFDRQVLPLNLYKSWSRTRPLSTCTLPDCHPPQVQGDRRRICQDRTARGPAGAVQRIPAKFLDNRGQPGLHHHIRVHQVGGEAVSGPVAPPPPPPPPPPTSATATAPHRAPSSPCLSAPLPLPLPPLCRRQWQRLWHPGLPPVAHTSDPHSRFRYCKSEPVRNLAARRLRHHLGSRRTIYATPDAPRDLLD